MDNVKESPPCFCHAVSFEKLASPMQCLHGSTQPVYNVGHHGIDVLIALSEDQQFLQSFSQSP